MRGSDYLDGTPELEPQLRLLQRSPHVHILLKSVVFKPVVLFSDVEKP